MNARAITDWTIAILFGLFLGYCAAQGVAPL
jgi:hypothetical protein